MKKEKNVELANAAAQHPEIGEYLLAQNYNLITRYLHSIRYRHLKHFLTSLCNQSAHSTVSLFEIGSGYGKSLEAIQSMPNVNISNYFGINIEDQFSRLCEQKYGSPTHQFLTADIRSYAQGEKQLPFIPDAIISLECFEHINEYDVPSVVEWLHSLNRPLFISVPNETGLAVLFKNLGSFLMGYHRYKEYTWLETWNASRHHLEKVAPHNTGHKGFDWHWLAAVLNQKFKITQIGTSPWNFVPRTMSLSLYFHCKPR